MSGSEKVSPDHIRRLDEKTLGRKESEIEKHANSSFEPFPDQEEIERNLLECGHRKERLTSWGCSCLYCQVCGEHNRVCHIHKLASR